jgi:hypothetical protein
VLLFSFEGLDLLEERMANGPLVAEVANLVMACCKKAIGYRLLN